jgi:nitrogen regulatory protein P-II 1
VRLVVAVFPPEALDEVWAQARDLGASGMTIAEVHGVGHLGGHTEVYRGQEFEVDYVPRLRAEILVDDLDATLLVEAIVRATSTGATGDGKVWVMPVDTAVRVSTGERGDDAL